MRGARLRDRGVAQLGSAPASGAGGRWFKSSRPDHLPPASGCRSPRRRALEERRAVMPGRLGAAEVVVEGRVQGVGYRNFAQRRAPERPPTRFAGNPPTRAAESLGEGGPGGVQEYLP